MCWSSRLIAVSLLGVAIFSPLQAQQSNFGSRVDLGLIELGALSEASGIAASRKNAEVLWAHNDSGDSNRVFAFNRSGKHLGIFTLAGVQARDWEDLALGPGPEEGADYLYIGEIGDNGAQHDLKYVYRVREPEVAAHQAPVALTLTAVETIAWRYPDGRRDAETLMLDPATKDLYVVSKREAAVRVYRAAYPQSTTDTITLAQVTTLSFGGVTAGAISSTGAEILIKTYDTIYYWKRSAGQTVAQALSQTPIKIPYIVEPQGEALCWQPEGKGYYTLSEEFRGIPARLYFYPRLASTGLKRYHDSRRGPALFSARQLETALFSVQRF